VRTLRQKNRGQSSIEYLLILTAFFASLGLILPIISSSVDSFLLMNDTILSKEIFEELNEICSLYNFSGNGSSKELIYSPSEIIKIKNDGQRLIISSSEVSAEKEFVINCKNNSFFEKSFESKFSINISKENNAIAIIAEEI
jgi:hypothetical protein